MCGRKTQFHLGVWVCNWGVFGGFLGGVLSFGGFLGGPSSFGGFLGVVVTSPVVILLL